MTTTNLNAQALANSARECIRYAQSTKWTIAKIVNHWNLCVEQSGLTGSYDFPTDYKRKAHLIAGLERCVEQLTNIAEGRDALVAAPVEERRETMVQDVKKGMVVINPVSGELNTITHVNDFSCYFIISFSGDMNQQYFDRGETLMVCEAEQATQITDVLSINNEDVNMSTVFEHLLNAGSCEVSQVSLNNWFINEAGSLCKIVEEPTVEGFTQYVDFKGNLFSVRSNTLVHPVTDAMSNMLNG